MKKIKIITSLGLLGVMSLNLLNTNSTSAYEKNTAKNTDNLEMRFWNQARWASGYNLPLKNEADTLSSSGCGYFSLTNLLIKTKSVDEKFKPNDLLKRVKSKGLQDTSWGHFNFRRLNELGYNLKYVKHDYSVSGMNINKLQSYLKNNVYNKGYYAIICLSNGFGGHHYVAMDYIDSKGDVRIYDSGYVGTWLKDFYSNKQTSYVIILKSDTDIRDTFSFYRDESAKNHNAIVQKKIDEIKQKEKEKEEAERKRKEDEEKNKVTEVDKIISIKDDEVINLNLE